MKKLPQKRLAALLCGLLLICAGIALFVRDHFTDRGFGVLDDRILVDIPFEQLPEGTLYITEARRYYERGKITLIIPSIDIFTPVGESTSPEGLQEMPGLYEFSQMPWEQGGNVSIAGHRDIHDRAFYFLDQLDAGDFAYLLYDGYVFCYRYRDTQIVKPDQWDIIRPQGFECMTLTTCDPIGTTINRMVVRLELVDYRAFDESYQFVATQSTQP